MAQAHLIRHVLVTGATGFIGAHVVNGLLERGHKVRGATRTIAKGEAMRKARPQHVANLEYVEIEDFETGGNFVTAVKDIDAVIHVASVRQCPQNAMKADLKAIHIQHQEQ